MAAALMDREASASPEACRDTALGPATQGSGLFRPPLWSLSQELSSQLQQSPTLRAPVVSAMCYVGAPPGIYARASAPLFRRSHGGNGGDSPLERVGAQLRGTPAERAAVHACE